MGHSGSKAKSRRNAAASGDGLTKIIFDEQTAGNFNASADSYGNLKPLPRDLLVVIFSMLTPSDLATLCRVSKGVYTVVCSNLLWKIMYERRWGKGHPRKEIKSIAWRELFNKRTKNNLNPKDDPFWDTLSVHGNDTTLDADFATHTWTLDLPPGVSYRAFRIIQTGKNKYVAGKDLKDEWGHVLVASGFEMYGILHENGTPEGNITQTITYQKDAKDKKGVISTLGGHPKVEVMASSLSPGKYVENFISTDDVYVWTRNEKYSWFAVDLGANRSVEPTHYTLRYGSGGNYCCPRNWLLQGTNNIEVLREDKENPMDDPKWDTLKVHLDDTTLDGDWAVHTWVLDTLPATPYRTFRVIQVGKNKYQVPKNESKDRWSDVFVISGFEIYGTLVEKKKKKPSKEKRFIFKEDPNKDYSASMDRNGIITAVGANNVKVFASSIASGKVVENFVSKEPHHNWTQNEKYAWYAVDFGEERSVIPTHYTLRYGSGGNLCCPRNWLLQATNSVTAIRQNR